MNNDLARLLEAAQKVPMSKDDFEIQRQSFVFGNTQIENESITRDLVRVQASLIAE